MKNILFCILLSTLFLSGCNYQKSDYNTSLSSSDQMNSSILTDNLQILKNTLYVDNMQNMQAFYTDVMWFDMMWTWSDRVLLGKNNQTRLELIYDQQAQSRNHNGAWLYHIAYLFDTQAWLANALRQVAISSPESFDWSADHSVSEAFYFHDPEWNGIELYYDKPSDTWTWSGDRVVMWSVYIDPNRYITTYSDSWWDNFFKIWHNHLKVWDIDKAKQFYIDVLWFDITAEAQGALFVSVDWYHHHFGLNVWESNGASIRPYPQLWLGHITLQLWSEQDITRLISRLEQYNISFTKNNNWLQTQDPRGNIIIFQYK